MNLKSKHKLAIATLSILFFTILNPVLAMAQESLSLSITPPLIKNNLEPGQVWKGSIKLINNNPDEIRAYVLVKDFKSGEEDGTAVFIDSAEGEGRAHLLSDWIVINEGPYPVAPGTSEEIPFIIEVPKDASPGGHYAAILTGTKPPKVEGGGSSVRISTMLATLLLMNVSGDTNEAGNIREFSTDKRFYGKSDVNFTVRFANQGNIHLQPQGEIKIYDVFNKEKDSITINHKSEFGNVLPESTRKWEFNWQGEDGLLATGRYKAELILTFGENGKETKHQILYFWIIKYKPLLIIFSIIAFLVLLLILFVKRSIKKAIRTTQELAGFKESLHMSRGAIAPGNTDEELLASESKKGWHFLKIFFIVLLVLLVAILAVLGVAYFNDLRSGQIIPVIDSQEPFEQNNAAEDIGAGTEIMEANTASSTFSDMDKESDGGKSPADEAAEERASIIILNGSGQAGAASKAAELFEQNGLLVINTGNADSFDYKNTLVRYKSEHEKTVIRIMDLFDSEVEMESIDEQAEDIIVIIGKSGL